MLYQWSIKMHKLSHFWIKKVPKITTTFKITTFDNITSHHQMITFHVLKPFNLITWNGYTNLFKNTTYDYLGVPIFSHNSTNVKFWIIKRYQSFGVLYMLHNDPKVMTFMDHTLILSFYIENDQTWCLISHWIRSSLDHLKLSWISHSSITLDHLVPVK